MLFWRKREKHYHRGKISDFPRLARDWLGIRAGGESQIHRRWPEEVCPPPHCHSRSKSHFCCLSHPMLAGLGPCLTANLLGNSCVFLPPFPLWVTTAAPAWMSAVGAGELKNRNSPCHFPRALSCAASKASAHACNIFIMALLLKVFLCSPKLR